MWWLIALNLLWWEPVQFYTYEACVQAWQRTEIEMQKEFPVLNPRFRCVQGLKRGA